MNRQTFLRNVTGGLEDRARLHLGDLRVGIAQTAATMTQHRVLFVQFLDTLEDPCNLDSGLCREVLLALLVAGQELVQRRIQQADRHGVSLHRLEDPVEVLTLERQQLGQGDATIGLVVGHDHLAHRRDAVAFKEHVLGAAEADALRAELDGARGVQRVVGVRADRHSGELVRDRHQALELAVVRRVLRVESLVQQDLNDFGRRGFDLAQVNGTGRAIDADPVAFAHDVVVDLHQTVLVVDLNVRATGHANLAALTSDQCSVRRHAAALGQDALGGLHALDILGGGLNANQDRLVAPLRDLLLDLVAEERHATGRRARTGGQALRHQAALSGRFLDCLGVEDRAQQEHYLTGLDAGDRGFLVNHALFQHVDRYVDGGQAGTLSRTTLQDEQLALFDREFQVLHVAVMVFQHRADLNQFFVCVRHHLSHLGDLQRCADTGHDVLALRVHQELAVENVFAGRCVTREGDAGAAVVTHVAENHGLDVDRGTPVFRDAVDAAVLDRARVHPGIEHGVDRQAKLLTRTNRKITAGTLEHDLLFQPHDFFQFLGRQLGVQLFAALLLDRLKSFLKGIVLALLALDAQDDVAEHLDEAAVAVHRETAVAGRGRQGLDRRVIQAQVEDRVHHAGHRGASAGTHRNQQRVLRVAQFLAVGLLKPLNRFLDLGLKAGRPRIAVPEVMDASLGRNRESRGNVQADLAHLVQVRALAAQGVLHVAVAFDQILREPVDPLVCHLTYLVEILEKSANQLNWEKTLSRSASLARRFASSCSSRTGTPSLPDPMKLASGPSKDAITFSTPG